MHRSAQKQGTISSDWGVPPSWSSKLPGAQLLFAYPWRTVLSLPFARAYARQLFFVFLLHPSHGCNKKLWFTGLGVKETGFFLFTFLTQQISPLLSNKITDWACKKCRSDVRNRHAAGSPMWCSHQDVRTGLKGGGKRKHAQPSTTRKEKYPMERKEKHLTKERETTDRRKEKHSIE